MERKDFTIKEFYDILVREPEIPVTAHITSITFMDRFVSAYEEGYSHIIVVTINSKGSNTYNAAVMAKDMFYEEYPHAKEKISITVMDSLTYTLGYGLPIIKAAAMAADGESAFKVISALEDMLSRVEIYFTMYTLKFAKKSGRIRAAAAFMGDMLGLRAVMHITDGEIRVVDKVRGDKNTFPRMIALTKERRREEAYTDYVVLGGMDDDLTDEFTKICKKELGKKYIDTCLIGAAIAINAGPQLTGVVFFGDKRDKI